LWDTGRVSSALVGIGPTPVEVPPVVHALAGRLRPGATAVPVWRNDYGGLTVRLGPAAAPSRTVGPYLKWVPETSACPDPLAEADRLVWAGSFTRVPHVLDAGRDEHGSWLLTSAVRAGGEVATSARSEERRVGQECTWRGSPCCGRREEYRV